MGGKIGRPPRPKGDGWRPTIRERRLMLGAMFRLLDAARTAPLVREPFEDEQAQIELLQDAIKNGEDVIDMLAKKYYSDSQLGGITSES